MVKVYECHPLDITGKVLIAFFAQLGCFLYANRTIAFIAHHDKSLLLGYFTAPNFMISAQKEATLSITGSDIVSDLTAQGYFSVDFYFLFS